MSPNILVLGWLMFFLLIYILGRISRHSVEVEQKHYETEFLSQNREIIEQYQAKILPFIPLRIEHRHPENLSSLCLQYPKLRLRPVKYINEHLVRKFGPRIQVELIRFRRVDEGLRPSQPLRIELIRCSENFAVITAGTGNYTYYMVRDNNSSDRSNLNADATFFITGKFKYKEQVPPANAQPIEQTQILGENRSTGDLSRRHHATSDANVDVQHPYENMTGD